MLELSETLPPGALCAATPQAAGTALRDALWWHASPQTLQTDPKSGAIINWHAQGDAPPAVPTDPNTGHGQIGEAGDLIGLQCKPQTHCGMVAPAVTQDAATTTIAVRFYTPPGLEARTLFTLNTGENYVFLSETDGTLTAKDDNDLVLADLPLPPQDAPHLAIVSLHSDHLALRANGHCAAAKAPKPILQGPADLFIGCRNQRPRLLKTLGAALILDVIALPGRALLHAPTSPELQAIHRHHLWAAA